MITDFRNWVTAVGNDDTNEYSFPFKISDLSEIVVVQLDISSDPTTIDFIERGDVGLNVQEIEFDSVLGGGKVIFAENLPVDKRIYIKMANDAPTQPSRFREQKDFKIRSIEDALDFVVTQTTRLTDKAEATMRFADHFSHVESVVNLQMPEFPMAHGMPIMDTEALQLNMKPFLTILAEQGTQAQIDLALANSQDAADDAAAAAASALAAQASAAAAEADADAAAASAAAAVGASVSNRIQVTPYAPGFMGAPLVEEYEQEVYTLGIDNRVVAFAKMSQYFIAGRPIKVGFNGYSTTFDLTSKYKIQLTATLVKNGEEVTSTVNQEILTEEVTVTAVASALKVFSFEISADGNINGVAVAANDAIKLEFKRIDASANEDAAETRLFKHTFELSFA